jgi:hypothetical protein
MGVLFAKVAASVAAGRTLELRLRMVQPLKPDMLQPQLVAPHCASLATLGSWGGALRSLELIGSLLKVREVCGLRLYCSM